MPTVRQLFAFLREDVEQEAIEETRKHYESIGLDTYLDRESSCKTVEAQLMVSFDFTDSGKGLDYWAEIIANPPLKTQQDA